MKIDCSKLECRIPLHIKVEMENPINALYGKMYSELENTVLLTLRPKPWWMPHKMWMKIVSRVILMGWDKWKEKA